MNTSTFAGVGAWGTLKLDTEKLWGLLSSATKDRQRINLNLGRISCVTLDFDRVSIVPDIFVYPSEGGVSLHVSVVYRNVVFVFEVSRGGVESVLDRIIVGRDVDRDRFVADVVSRVCLPDSCLVCTERSEKRREILSSSPSVRLFGIFLSAIFEESADRSPFNTDCTTPDRGFGQAGHTTASPAPIQRGPPDVLR